MILARSRTVRWSANSSSSALCGTGGKSGLLGLEASVSASRRGWGGVVVVTVMV